MNNAAEAPQSQSGADSPWKRALLWLLLLGPFFFLSYGYANKLAAARSVTDSVVFGWERDIPFVPWTIVPYWSIDLFYGLSFLSCRTREQVDRHALRLLSAQLISVACFILFPLHFSFERPATDGFFGSMFDLLTGFDQPYNQAPSLHISLLVILWVRYAAATSGAWRMIPHLMAALIGVSVLTTYQHHFIDVPTGALVGLFCLWLWPDAGAPPWSRWQLAHSAARLRITALYFLAALALATIAAGFGGSALWLWWPAVSLLMVALIYLGIGADGFQKAHGRLSIAVLALLAPYLAGAWLNSRWWTRHHPLPDEIADGVWLGRMPTRHDMKAGGFAALCDFTAELAAPQGDWQAANLPCLDLLVPDADQLLAAARIIEAQRGRGPLLVCCALGYSRSACAVAAWLLLTGRALTAEEAISRIALRRPKIALGAAHRRALAECLGKAAAETAHV